MKDVSEHLEAHLGPIAHGWGQRESTRGLSICAFDDQPVPAATSLVTLGLSNHVLRLNQGRTVRQELMLSFYGDARVKTEMSALLFSIAERVLNDHQAVLRGEVLPLDGTITPGMTAAGLYASIPVLHAEGLATFSMSTPPTVVVWLFPIWQAELEFVMSRGWNEFENILETSGVDLLNLGRQPAI